MKVHVTLISQVVHLRLVTKTHFVIHGRQMEAVMGALLDLFLYKENAKPLVIYVRNGTQ